MQKLLFFLFVAFFTTPLFAQNNCPNIYIQPIGNLLTVVRADSMPVDSNALVIWNVNDTSYNYLVTQTGVYTVRVLGGGCIRVDSIYFQMNNACSASLLRWPDQTFEIQATGQAPFTYLWSNGATTKTLLPSTEGYYSAQVMDATGCVVTTGAYWYKSGACAAQINIFQDSSLNGAPIAWLQAYPAPVAPISDWTYNWSTGESSVGIGAAQAGNYCVTITNRFTGCSASSCVFVQPNRFCRANVAATRIDAFNQTLNATIVPGTAVSYQWSTGSTVSNINVTAPGYYDVTITNDVGCTVTAGKNMWGQSLAINVMAGLDSIAPGRLDAEIFLIKYSPDQGGILTLADTFRTIYTWSAGTGYVYKQNIPPGEYLVKAALLPTSTLYEQYLPTYYENSAMWGGAKRVFVDAVSENSNNDVLIQMIEGQNTGGPGFIGGLVSEGANFGGIDVDGLNVFLMKMDGTPLYATLTHNGGHYEFENLPWGTYKLTIDMPGMKPVITVITIGPNQPSVPNVDFWIDNDSIALSDGEIIPASDFSVFPNPMSDYFWMELPENADLYFQNIQGQTVWSTNVTAGNIQVMVPAIPSGVYTITAKMQNGIKTAKIIKN
jgi:hypothetical protein